MVKKLFQCSTEEEEPYLGGLPMITFPKGAKKKDTFYEANSVITSEQSP